MAIKVLKPGLATTVQDAGRQGYYNVGIPLSGALDQYSVLAANLLVSNDANAAVLECTLMGPELEFQRDAVIAVTGAEMAPKLNGAPAARNEAISIKAGTVVSFDFMRVGARAYIAVAGGIDVPVILGSRSTYGLGAFGGFQGRKLQAGDVVPVGLPKTMPKVGMRVPDSLAMPLPKELELRVVPGLYFHRITDESAQTFFEDTWSVALEADRIGYRYKQGRPLKFRDRKQPFGAGSDPSNIVDAGYPYGSIQVPGGLEPIILHRDAVSGGGYAMIGTVISADMDSIAQMQPNYKARFVKVDLDAALAARADRNRRLQHLGAALVS
jgi:urea carboxylase